MSFGQCLHLPLEVKTYGVIAKSAGYQRTSFDKNFKLKQQILNFHQEQRKLCDLQDEKFCRNIAFLSNVIKQNNLNICLHDKIKHICEMWQKIGLEKKKINIFKTLLSCSDVSAEHFPELAKTCKK